MSILNVLMQPDHALVGVDTDAVVPADGRHFHMSKLIPLPAANAVLAHRGNSFSQVLGLIHSKATAPDIDGLLLEVPALLDNLAAELLAIGQELETQLAIVGWSNRLQRPIGQFFKVRPNGGGFFATDILDGLAEPDTSCPLPWETATDMVRVAREQIAWIRETCPDGLLDGRPMSGGGKFLVARIDRSGVSVTTACDLGAANSAPMRELQENPVVYGSIVTRTIAAENITVPRSAYTAGTVNLTSATNVTVQSLSFPSKGGVVNVLLSAYHSTMPGSGATNMSVRFSLWRDATQLCTWAVSFSPQNFTDTFGANFQDTPGAGTCVYYMKANILCDGAGSNTDVLSRSLIALETLK